MKKLFVQGLIGLALFFVLSCRNRNTAVGGNLPPTHLRPPVETPAPEVLYVYGQKFSASGGSLYSKLLEACRRCGLERFFDTPSGTAYQRFWILGDSVRDCKNWGGGYIQIEFQENKLPTTATVSIWPEYTGSNAPFNPWGQPFAVSARAKPINENEGFQIILTPSDGLRDNLNIWSEYSNHVNKSYLDIEVSYGQSDQIIISEQLLKLSKKAVSAPAFDCHTYTN